MALLQQFKKLARVLRLFFGGQGTEQQEGRTTSGAMGDGAAAPAEAVTSRRHPCKAGPLHPDAEPLFYEEQTVHENKGTAHTVGNSQDPTMSEGPHVERVSKQVPGERIEETDVILGFDFGTSLSKIVIRTPFFSDGRAVPIPAAALGGGRAGYLIPSGIFLDSTGRICCSESLGDGSTYPSSLKIRLYKNPSNADAQARVTAFLADSLRHAKKWYLNHELKSLAGRRPRWAFNLGIPTPGYGDERIKETFLRVARAAWRLSEDPSSITLDTCRNALSASGTADSGIKIGVVPEVIAEVVGYARSNRREEGLHVLVDIGAFTTDVCGFLLSNDESGDRYSLLVSNVEPLGVHQLHYFREELGGRERCSDVVKSIDLKNPLARFPHWISGYYPTSDSRFSNYREREHSDFRSPFERQITRCLHSLKKKRDPYSDKWAEGIPVFLGGGGADMEWYQGALTEVNREFRRRYQGVGQFRIKPFTKPDQLSNKDIDPDTFRRIAVAYGLGFDDEFEVGTIEASSRIDDVPPPPVREPFEFISKDQV